MSMRGTFAPPDADEIVPGLHIGSAPRRRAARAIARAGVSHAVDLRETGQYETPWPVSVRTLGYPLAEYQAPTMQALDEVSARIATLVQGGEVVYVHCREGVQRAPMVACAVLVQMGWGLAEAFRLVATRRTISSMSEAQLAVLMQLDKVVKDRSVVAAS